MRNNIKIENHGVILYYTNLYKCSGKYFKTTRKLGTLADLSKQLHTDRGVFAWQMNKPVLKL